jgi:Fe2+ or Zn2+ uptake regulation protein
MSALEVFDQSTATMRLLLALRNQAYPMTRLTLLRKLREENVGRTAAYKALEVCENLGLVVETAYKVGGARVLSTDLSEKGKSAAFYVAQIQLTLSRWGTSEYKPTSLQQ